MKKSNGRNRTVVITGASSGFGRGVGERFAKDGMSLVLASRREGRVEELARKCETHGARALAVKTAVSLREQVEESAQRASSAFGRLDIWINNGGVGSMGSLT